jgi:hypothetical protein
MMDGMGCSDFGGRDVDDDVNLDPFCFSVCSFFIFHLSSFIFHFLCRTRLLQLEFIGRTSYRVLGVLESNASSYVHIGVGAQSQCVALILSFLLSPLSFASQFAVMAAHHH